MATVQITESNIDATITGNDIVFLDFWAQWCGPCRAFGPTFEAASEKYPDIIFGKVNTEEEQALGQAFQIRSIPMLMAFREQIPVFGQPGALPASSFEDLIKQVMALDMADVRAKYEEQVKAHQAKEES